MSFNIIKQLNADAQEGSAADAAELLRYQMCL